jgi:hypothetical protein
LIVGACDGRAIGQRNLAADPDDAFDLGLCQCRATISLPARFGDNACRLVHGIRVYRCRKPFRQVAPIELAPILGTGVAVPQTEKCRVEGVGLMLGADRALAFWGSRARWAVHWFFLAGETFQSGPSKCSRLRWAFAFQIGIAHHAARRQRGAMLPGLGFR